MVPTLVRPLTAALAILGLLLALPHPAGAAVEEGLGGERVRLVVGLGSAAPASEIAAVAARAGGRQTGTIDSIGVRVLELPAAARTGVLRRLIGMPGVEFAEEDGVSVALREPNDERFDHQWGLQRVAAPAAWDSTVGSEDVIIAILDTGVNPDHEDLRGAVLPGANMVDPGASTDDTQGHGTKAAGVAAARADNRLGVAGACWRCRILPITVLDEEGRGPNVGIAAGIVEAVDRGASVISLSLGSRQRSEAIARAVDYARRSDVVVVAAAGNFGTSDSIYPAAFDTVIGVAGSTSDDERYSWSSFGPWVQLAAPGCNETTGSATPSSYGVYCGTSSSAPLVAGIAALARSAEPLASTIDIEQSLRSAAHPVDYTAWGRVDAARTLTALADRMVGGRTPIPDGLNEPMEPGPEPIGTEVDRDPDAGARSTRVAGPDRFATAAALSAGTFAPGVARAYLATGADFPDALSAGAAAAAAGGPVLLTARTGLPAVVADELRRLAPQEVVVVGGAGAVADAVLEQAGHASGATVRRVSGTDRFATAAALAADWFGMEAPTVYVATGADFPDALAGVPAAAREAAPLLLVTRDQVPRATAETLARLQPTRVVLLGGTGAVSAATAERLRQIADPPGGVQRLAGGDRFATAAVVARAAFPGTAETVHLATGANFPDALAGGPAAAAADGPLLLGLRDALPQVTAEALRRLAPDTIVVLGGAAAIGDGAVAAARQAAAEGQPQ